MNNLEVIMVRLLTEILSEVKNMAADFRGLILANDEENKRLAEALREADAKIASQRRRISELESELNAIKESPETQAQIDALALASQKRVLAIDTWLAQVVRA